RQVSGTGDYLDVDWIDAPENDDHLYVASAKAGLVALDARSGEPSWTFPLPGANHVLVEGAKVIGGGQGLLVAVDRAKGTRLWSCAREPARPRSGGCGGDRAQRQGAGRPAAAQGRARLALGIPRREGGTIRGRASRARARAARGAGRARLHRRGVRAGRAHLP